MGMRLIQPSNCCLKSPKIGMSRNGDGLIHWFCQRHTAGIVDVQLTCNDKGGPQIHRAHPSLSDLVGPSRENVQCLCILGEVMCTKKGIHLRPSYFTCLHHISMKPCLHKPVSSRAVWFNDVKFATWLIMVILFAYDIFVPFMEESPAPVRW